MKSSNGKNLTESNLTLKWIELNHFLLWGIGHHYQLHTIS